MARISFENPENLPVKRRQTISAFMTGQPPHDDANKCPTGAPLTLWIQMGSQQSEERAEFLCVISLTGRLRLIDGRRKNIRCHNVASSSGLNAARPSRLSQISLEKRFITGEKPFVEMIGDEFINKRFFLLITGVGMMTTIQNSFRAFVSTSMGSTR
jgi:hypothetical protein